MDVRPRAGDGRQRRLAADRDGEQRRGAQPGAQSLGVHLADELGARTPPDLARAVQLLNVAALLAFAAFGLLAIPRERREPWLWAAALWAANPASVILERKIWSPSVLPLPAVGLLWAWRYRRHPAAAFAWGALGALMAQIHLGAAFFAAALMVWTLLADRRAFPGSAGWPAAWSARCRRSRGRWRWRSTLGRTPRSPRRR